MRLASLLYLGPLWLGGALLILPLATLAIYALQANILELLPVMTHYLSNTIILLIGTSVGAGLLGTVLAGLVSFFRFPYARFFEWALILPLSMPSYIIAYRMQELNDASIGRFLFDLRSLTGLIILFTLVLYPYVYLIAKTAFQKQSGVILDAARVMGLSYLHSVIRVAVPLCWPAIIAGISLVALEVLNEYGAVAFSSVPTLSIGIIELWYVLGEVNAAAQLCMITLLFVMCFVLIEKFGRGQRRFYHDGGGYHPQRISIMMNGESDANLRGLKACLACLLCSMPIFFGFALPSLLLLSDSLNIELSSIGQYWVPARNSILLASITAIICVLLGIIAGYVLRNRYRVNILAKLMQLGYALPSILMAVGLILGFSALANILNHIFAWLGFLDTQIYFSGSVLLMLIAYILRFNHIATSGIYSNMQKLSPALDDVAKTLGRKKGNILRKVHLPLLEHSMRVIFLLIFVDVLKELPASLILRPFNFDTLAINVFEYASDERIEQAAPGALIIVLAGLLPVIYLSKIMNRGNV